MIKNLCHPITKRMVLNPVFQVYIHMKDHNIKVNPKENRLSLSYMDPKNQTSQAPTHPKYSGKLKKRAEEELQKRIFQDYKQKILQGRVDQEQVVQADKLWGEGEKPVHYYRSLSNSQISFLNHSIFKDLEQQRNILVKKYLGQITKIQNINATSDLNDLVMLSVNYRNNNIEDGTKYYQIQHKIGSKFHLLSDKSLILLKYAFTTPPKQCTPQFNRILNDLLTESLPKLTTNDLIFLMYFNRFDHFKLHKKNIQLSILEQLETRFSEMSQEDKINFLFLYVDSRGPTVLRKSHNRHYNQIRNKTQQLICLLNIDSDLSQLSEELVLKLTYVLIRSKTNMTDYLTNNIESYVQKNLEKLQKNNLALFFIYLSEIQSGKSIANLDLMKSLKQRVIENWNSLSPIYKIRSLYSMYNLKIYDEVVHQLYIALQIPVDNTMLGYFCRLQMMNSSGRQWQVIHRLVDLDYLPLTYFQDYKRFYNYVSATAPDWDLQPLKNKLTNTEIFYDSQRLKSLSMDKNYYLQIYKFQKFTDIKVLPKPFVMGCPIKNVEFCEFALPHYQISVDVVTDVERIRGTKNLKGSFEAKIKSLENIGWKHLYVFKQDVEYLNPLQFFDHLYKICQPHFESQLQIIASYEEYRSYEIEMLRQERIKSMLRARQLEKYLVTKDYNLLFEQDDEQEQRARKLAEKTKALEELSKKTGKSATKTAPGSTASKPAGQ